MAAAAGHLLSIGTLATALLCPLARAEPICDHRVEITFTEVRPAGGMVEYWARLRNLTPEPMALRFSASPDIATQVLMANGLVLRPGATLPARASGAAHIASYPLVRGYRPSPETVASLLRVACGPAG